MNNIRVIIIHHSATVRIKLKKIFHTDPGIEVIASTYGVQIASKRMQKEWPHVIILGIDKDRSDTYSFIEQVIDYKSTAFLIITNLNEEYIKKELKSKAFLACEVIVRPRFDTNSFFNKSQKLILESLRSVFEKGKKNKRNDVAVHKPFNFISSEKTQLEITAKLSPDLMLPPWNGQMVTVTTERIVAIGASAGGIKAIEKILTGLPRNSPGIVIVQHLPGRFTNNFAERVNSRSQIIVQEAKNGDIVQKGIALIAPGGKHMIIVRENKKYKVVIKDGPLITRHKPSVDILFRSLAICGGKNILGIILTGMGDDGAQEMVALRASGAYTIAQNKESCAVFGMPYEAIKLGAAVKVLHLNKIADAIIQFYQEKLK